MMKKVHVIYRKKFVKKDNKHENSLVAVFSNHKIALGFRQTLLERLPNDEYIVDGLILNKYTLDDAVTTENDDTCKSLDLRKHIPFDLNQMECTVSCTICKSHSIYFCKTHNKVFCSKHITNHF
jgi:hypothetical protein